jgi:hypothetical protein
MVAQGTLGDVIPVCVAGLPARASGHADHASAIWFQASRKYGKPSVTLGFLDFKRLVDNRG